MGKTIDKNVGLHELVLKGNNLALSKLYDSLGNTILTKLKSRYPKFAKQDEGLFFEAVNDAFFGYFKNPFTFDSSKSSLQRFLEIAAERDLINILSREKKHLQTRKAPQDVELEEKFWNSVTKEGKTADGQLIAKQSMQQINTELNNYFENELDIVLAKLVISGERETQVFSIALGIESLDALKQRKEVKKHKDRIKKVLLRNDVEGKLKKILQ